MGAWMCFQGIANSIFLWYCYIKLIKLVTLHSSSTSAAWAFICIHVQSIRQIPGQGGHPKNILYLQLPIHHVGLEKDSMLMNAWNVHVVSV